MYDQIDSINIYKKIDPEVVIKTEQYKKNSYRMDI